jgi:hypothetical protein
LESGDNDKRKLVICNGVRDVTGYVNVPGMDERSVRNDLMFLGDVDRRVYCCKRNVDEVIGNDDCWKPKKIKKTVLDVALFKRDIKVIKLSKQLSASKNNNTVVTNNVIRWSVDVVFCGVAVTDDCVIKFDNVNEDGVIEDFINDSVFNDKNIGKNVKKLGYTKANFRNEAMVVIRNIPGAGNGNGIIGISDDNNDASITKTKKWSSPIPYSSTITEGIKHGNGCWEYPRFYVVGKWEGLKERREGFLS